MNRTTVIAEAGVNHNGSLDMALALVEAAANAGADVVKFQTFDASAGVCRNAEKAAYQKETTGSSESQLEMVKRYELSESDHTAILQKCGDCGIEFLSTPFDIQSVDLLERMGVARYKVSSGEVTNWPLLRRVGMTGKPLILSTGMATLEEIGWALGVYLLGALDPDRRPTEALAKEMVLSARGRVWLEKNMTLLHCTTQYPAPFEDVNLRAMDLLRETFGLPVGYSDHTEGIFTSVCATARGAVVIEKHVTLDKTLPGPDHQASVTPEELAALVREVKQVELLLGEKEKKVTESERDNVKIARKSLVASKEIAKGELFSPENLGIKRPGSGVLPTKYWEYLGTAAEKNYMPDELI